MKMLVALDNQTSDQFEAIFVDNNSTDCSVEMVKSFKTKAKYPLTLLSEAQKGVGYARKRGMDVAEGEFIAGSDSDSEPESSWIEGIIRNFASTKADLLAGDVSYFSKLEGEKFLPLKYLDKVRLVTSNLIRPRLRGINFAIKRDIYHQIGGIYQPTDKDGRLLPGEEKVLSDGVKKIGGKFEHMDTLVKGDPRRFLENLAKGEKGDASLYVPNSDGKYIVDIRNLDTRNLLEKIAEDDVSLFVDRQLKNMFRKDVLEVYMDPAKRIAYWGKSKVLVGGTDLDSEASLDDLWAKYKEEFKKNLDILIKTYDASLKNH